MRDIIVIERDLLKSEAFRTLNGQQKTVLFDFMMKRQIKQVRMSGGVKVPMIMNNGQIQYTYKEALKRGITRRAFALAIDRLIEHGFIDIAKQGSGGKQGDVSLYSISERWRKWGTSEFDSGRARVKDTRQGRGFAVVWKRRRNEAPESTFGNNSYTQAGIQNGTPKSDFEVESELSNIQNVTRKKSKKRPRGAAPLGDRPF